jgi:hypothetical protein
MLRRFALPVALAAVTVACSGPPTKERQQADGALAAARRAGAATYAPAELKAAEAALSQYDAAVALGEYRQALGLALDARDKAYEAARRAADERAAAKSQAERLITGVEAGIATAKTRLSGSGSPRLTGQAASRLRGTLKTAVGALQEARSAMKAENFRAVVAALTPIEANLQRDLAAPAPAAGRRGR